MSKTYDIMTIANSAKIECEKCKTSPSDFIVRIVDKQRQKSATYLCIKHFEEIQGKL